MRLGLQEDAILTLVEMPRLHRSWRERSAYMGKLVALAERETDDRRSGKRPQKISDGSLSRFKSTAAIMGDFARSCGEKGIGFDVTLNAFENEAAFDPMAFFALYHREFLLAGKIASIRPQAVAMIVGRLVETLKCDGVAATAKYLIEMADKIRGAEYEELASHFVVAVAERCLTRKVDLEKFIVANVRGSELQAKLLMRYGLLRKAK
jgi:hypothetical protein